MSGPHYHFITRWRMEGKSADAYEILSDPLNFLNWWKGVGLGVRELKRGDESGLNKVVEFRMKAFYALCWQSCSVEAQRPRRFSFEATGDFSGRGTWTFDQDGQWVNIVFDWNILAEKPFLKNFSFLLRPFFITNHNRVMARWEKALRRELSRRRGHEFS